jgi:hypothetical protein
MMESALFILGGLLLVFPSVVGAIIRPLTGITIDTFVPGLEDAGFRIGFNVLLGLVAFAAGVMIQRARPA